MKQLFVLLLLGVLLFGCTQSAQDNAAASAGEVNTWIENERDGISIIRSNGDFIFSGVAETQYWSAESNVYRQQIVQEFSANVQLTKTNATGSDIGLVLTDGVNFLGMSKHWGDSTEGWESDCLVAENGSLVKALTAKPMGEFTNFKIKRTKTGYEAYCNGTLLYSGTLQLDSGITARIKASARAIGDRLDGTVKNVQIK